MNPSWAALLRNNEMRGREDLPLNPSQLPIKEIAIALAERAGELGLTWRLVPAAVISPGASGQMRVILDGDTVPIDATSMIGRLPVGGRVFCVLSPPAGVHIVGFAGADFPPSVVGEAIGRPRMIVKASNENFTVSTPIAGMSFVGAARAAYEIRLRLSVAGNYTADVRVDWSVPSGAAMERYVLGAHVNQENNFAINTMFMGRRPAGDAQASATFASSPGSGSSDYPGYWEDIQLRMGATGGTVQLLCARLATSNTLAVRANSYMVVQRYR